MSNFVVVKIPKQTTFIDNIHGQCGGCRFKYSIKCLLFDKDTNYNEKTGAIKLKECPFNRTKSKML